jgi:hypothetical protein
MIIGSKKYPLQSSHRREEYDILVQVGQLINGLLGPLLKRTF